ncbi:MAG: hypothetical protein LBJ95_04145 [Oscillospiraceae bacterium]|jgi:hypothetical protein|nr:hypothetical protein [Oscillospiraceae bacterium]
MKKREHNTHKLLPNDDQGILSPQLLTEEELVAVTGGSTSESDVDATKPMIVAGEIWDDQIIIFLPGEGELTLTIQIINYSWNFPYYTDGVCSRSEPAPDESALLSFWAQHYRQNHYN